MKTKSLTEQIIELMPKELPTEMCESPCDNSCLKGDGYNQYRTKMINKIPEILSLIRGTIVKMPIYHTLKIEDEEYQLISKVDLLEKLK